jgi:hypothetical protein
MRHIITRGNNMLNIRVRIRYVPPTDLAFGAAVQEACAAASLAGLDIDAPDAARVVEEYLGTHGYPNVAISLFRTVDEYRSQATNWLIRRDGRGRTMPGRHASVSTRNDELGPGSAAP